MLEERLGGELEEVVVFGSVARSESWPRGMRIRSDLDLLVVTCSQVSAETEDELIHETMRLFLECGRQLGPHFRTRDSLEHPKDERDAAFVENVERDGIPDLPSFYSHAADFVVGCVADPLPLVVPWRVDAKRLGTRADASIGTK